MTTHEQTFKEVLAELTSGIATTAGELSAFEADAAQAKERGTPFSMAYYRKGRGEILARVAVAEAEARAGFDAYRAAALADARETRAAAEAGRDPQVRIAEELERARLAASPTNAERFVQQAREAVDAKQPRRAALYLGVALDKGWKGGFETDPETGDLAASLPRLIQRVEDHLDGEPDRMAARQIEESVIVNGYAFAQERKLALARHGIGVTEDGSIGSAHPSDVARASIGAKLGAFRAAQARGTFAQPEGYRDPEGVS